MLTWENGEAQRPNHLLDPGMVGELVLNRERRPRSTQMVGGPQNQRKGTMHFLNRAPSPIPGPGLLLLLLVPY